MTKVELRQVEPEDRARVVALCRPEFGPFADHLDLIWDWLLFSSPWHSKLEAPGWVLESKSGKIVGFIGVLAQPYQAAGQACVAAGATTFVVEREFRFHGLQLARAAMRPGSRLMPISTTASVDAARVFAAMKAQETPGGSISWVRPIELTPMFKAAASRRFEDRRSQSLAAGAAVVAGGAASLIHSITRSLRDPSGRHPASRVHDEQGITGIDELWSRLGPLFPWTCQRTEEWVRWRCYSHPAKRFEIFVARSSRVDGFAVARVQDRGTAGPALEVVDLFADPSDIETCDRLLAACVDRASEANTSFIEFKGGASSFEGTMKRWGFLSRDFGFNPCLWVGPRDVEIALPPSELSWHRTAIDGDAAI